MYCTSLMDSGLTRQREVKGPPQRSVSHSQLLSSEGGKKEGKNSKRLVNQVMWGAHNEQTKVLVRTKPQ